MSSKCRFSRYKPIFCKTAIQELHFFLQKWAIVAAALTIVTYLIKEHVCLLKKDFASTMCTHFAACLFLDFKSLSKMFVLFCLNNFSGSS